MTSLTPASNYISGIADQKKAEIDRLTELVSRAQYQVNQQQTIVDSLQAKAEKFTQFLSQADQNKATALSNRDLINDTYSSVTDLVQVATNAKLQTDAAASTIHRASENVAMLIDKLIFSVEIINKVTQLINRQKAVNPLIPGELVGFMTKAGADANNAIALTLNALQSVFAAEACLSGAQGLSVSAVAQLGQLQKRMSCRPFESGSCDLIDLYLPKRGAEADDDDVFGIAALLEQAYCQAVRNYDQALWNSNSVNKQLAYAKSQLAQANTRLSSYKAGLAAATTAAYAA